MADNDEQVSIAAIQALSHIFSQCKSASRLIDYEFLDRTLETIKVVLSAADQEVAKLRVTELLLTLTRMWPSRVNFKDMGSIVSDYLHNALQKKLHYRLSNGLQILGVLAAPIEKLNSLILEFLESEPIFSREGARLFGYLAHNLEMPTEILNSLIAKVKSNHSPYMTKIIIEALFIYARSRSADQISSIFVDEDFFESLKNLPTNFKADLLALIRPEIEEL